MIRPLLVVSLLAGCPYVGPGAADRFYDRDEDGVPWPDDCDDADAMVGLAITTFADHDGDGFGGPATGTLDCAPPADAITVGGDCDDQDADVNPDVQVYADADGDGYGDDTAMISACDGAPYATIGGDCDDDDAAISPAATDVCGDGVDSDCSGTDATCAPSAVAWPAAARVPL